MLANRSLTSVSRCSGIQDAAISRLSALTHLYERAILVKNRERG